MRPNRPARKSGRLEAIETNAYIYNPKKKGIIYSLKEDFHQQATFSGGSM